MVIATLLVEDFNLAEWYKQVDFSYADSPHVEYLKEPDNLQFL